MIRQEDMGRLRRFDGRPPGPVQRRPVQVPVARPRVAAPPTPAEAQPVATPSPLSAPVTLTRSRGRRRKAIVASLVCSLIIAGSVGFILLRGQTAANPIPARYRTAVDFPVYYPAAGKLPSGYKLNAASFSSPAANVIVYAIDYGDQHVAVSQQDKPASSDLQSFADGRIPLHTTQSTPVGQAMIGAIGNQSIVSLPTNSKTWIIVTAPYSINQSQLKQLLDSFTT